MKIVLFYSVTLLSLFTSLPVDGQVVENDASVGLLASHCAMSATKAGRADAVASDYSEYAGALAKTLSAFSSEQQGRIFKDSFVLAANAGRTAPNAASRDTEPAVAASAAVNDNESGILDPVVNAVGRFNSALFGKNGKTGPNGASASGGKAGGLFNSWEQADIELLAAVAQSGTEEQVGEVIQSIDPELWNEVSGSLDKIVAYFDGWESAPGSGENGKGQGKSNGKGK